MKAWIKCIPLCAGMAVVAWDRARLRWSAALHEWWQITINMHVDSPYARHTTYSHTSIHTHMYISRLWTWMKLLHGVLLIFHICLHIFVYVCVYVIFGVLFAPLIGMFGVNSLRESKKLGSSVFTSSLA